MQSLTGSKPRPTRVIAFGKDIPTTLEELVSHGVAVIVWDMQEGIARRAVNLPGIIPNVNAVTQAARQRRIPVIYSQHTSLPFEVESPTFIRFQWKRSGLPRPEDLQPLALSGSPSWQLIPEVAPQSGDVVLPKYRGTFFLGTPLLDLIRANRIQTLVLTGVATDRGVLNTARDAATNYGTFPVIVSDAVSAFSEDDQQRGLTTLASFADICDTRELLAAWSV